MPPSTQHPVRAGAAYFAVVFAIGFALGAVRTLFFVPRLGEQLSVLIELPLMLAASWFVCGWAVRRWQVPATTAPRLTMGVVAFALLMLAEVTLSLTAFDLSLVDYARNLISSHGLTGFAGQLVFAFMPLLQLRRDQPS